MTSVPQSQYELTSLNIRPSKKPRACLHCHIRKVRCNAWEVGIPCTRCKRRNQASTCVLANSSHRRVASALKFKSQKTTQNPQDVVVAPVDVDSGICMGVSAVSPTEKSPPPPLHVYQYLWNQTSGQLVSPDQSHAESIPALHVSPQENAVALDQPPQPHQSPVMAYSIEDEQSEARGGCCDVPTREEDVHFRICQEMSRGRAAAMSPSPQEQNLDRRELIELHEGINSMTILGEVLGRQRPNRLVRVVVANDGSKLCTHQPFPGLDHADMAYIAAKGALDFPPPRICDELVRLYFACIYPYAPILDRVKFMQDYRDSRHSSFLLQSILANAVPHAPKELLQEAGYSDRVTAQRSLYSKARILYDMGCEKSQLHLLQGSIMLSSLSFSYAMDKDYRYWLSNAGRIAIQMGLHRNYVSETLGTRTKRLFRRIWWVLYNRDTLLTISGIDNLRRFNDRYCDTAPLTESDWEEDTEIPVQFRDILCPMPRLQKLFMVEYSKLSIISGLFIRDFKTPNKTPSAEEIARLSDRICSWRKQLPVEMQIGILQEWSSDNIWILVLLAMGFRLEAVFCRAVKDHYRAQNDSASMQRIAQRQESAMFEFSTIIQRASMHEVLHLCPLSFMTCASTILAMRIEIALDPTISPRKLLATKTQIYADLEYLRESCEYWSSLIWTLRMFEAVVARTHLGLTPSTPNDTRNGAGDTPQATPQDGAPDCQKQTSAGRMDSWEDGSIAVGADADFSMSMADDAFGILPVTDNYNWLQNLFGAEHTDDFMESMPDFI